MTGPQLIGAVSTVSARRYCLRRVEEGSTRGQERLVDLLQAGAAVGVEEAVTKGRGINGQGIVRHATATVASLLLPPTCSLMPSMHETP